MDITTLIGLVACFCFVFLGIVTGNEGFAALGHFGDTVSVFITLGGSTCCMLVQACLWICVDFLFYCLKDA